MECFIVMAQAVYGFTTVLESETAVDQALVAEVARRIKQAKLQEPIRVLVMFQRPKVVT